MAEETGADIRAKAQRTLYERQQRGFGWFQLKKMSEHFQAPDLVLEWEAVDSYRVANWADGDVITIDELRNRLVTPSKHALASRR